MLLRVSKGVVDFGGQEVEVELLGLIRIEWMKAESLPPAPSDFAHGGHDDGSACGFLVELCGCREDVESERGPDPNAGVALIDGQPAEEKRGNRVRRGLCQDFGRGRPVDSGHGDARVCHHYFGGVGDDPRRGRVASPVLASVAAQPFVKRGLAAVELVAVVSARIEQRRTANLSQAS